jgi:hypothetical protein
VIGALALRHYGYIGHAEAIDILLTPEGLEKVHATLVGKGLVLRGPGLRKGLRQAEHEVNIDVVTPGEHAGSSDSPVECPRPDSSAFMDVAGVRFPTLDAIIQFKIASGVWGHRTQDLADVQRLIRINGLTATFIERLSPPLHQTFLHLLHESHLERELEK